VVDNPINETAAAGLAASPLGQRLAVLQVKERPAQEDFPPESGTTPLGEDIPF
jgi:hypothetical protein